jgi:hypothetical protein
MRRAFRPHAAWPVCLLVPTFAACGPEPAVGGPQAIVVGTRTAVWEQVAPALRETLEPTLYSLPDERAFDLEHADPTAEAWEEQRRARQLLLIGGPDDPWIEEALRQWRGPPPQVPSQTEVANVWARGQRVLVLLLPEEQVATALRAELQDVKTTYERWFREYVVERLYFPEGPDQALADTLRTVGGFDLLVPRSYRWSRTGDDVYRFAPAVGDTTTLSLNITVSWRSPIPSGGGSDPLALLEWREELSAETYGTPQSVELADLHGGTTTHRGSRALQLFGRWGSARSGGPFLLRGVMCPIQDRIYLLDGWLRAPDQRGYEHMIEIESILNSFRCGSAGR